MDVYLRCSLCVFVIHGGNEDLRWIVCICVVVCVFTGGMWMMFGGVCVLLVGVVDVRVRACDCVCLGVC